MGASRLALKKSMPTHDTARVYSSKQLTSTTPPAPFDTPPPVAVSFSWWLAILPPRARRFSAGAPGAASEVCDALRERCVDATPAPSSSRTRLRGMATSCSQCHSDVQTVTKTVWENCRYE
jgi:hypothetical protein